MSEPLLRHEPVTRSDRHGGSQTSPNARTAPDELSPPPAPKSPLRLRGALITAVVLAALWASLTPGDLASWWLGVPAVLGGAAVPLLLPTRDHPRLRLSLGGAAAFAVYFIAQSLVGAVDVAWRACMPKMPINPGFRTYTMTLPEGAAQLVMANAITLLPGTLSAEVNGQTIVVHMLDDTADLTAELTELEGRVARLFGLTLSNQEQPA